MEDFTGMDGRLNEEPGISIFQIEAFSRAAPMPIGGVHSCPTAGSAAAGALRREFRRWTAGAFPRVPKTVGAKTLDRPLLGLSRKNGVLHFSWQKDESAVESHADWRARIAKKNRRQGTSAPTVAAAWSGPLEVVGALTTQPALAGLVFEHAVIERQTFFDDFGGPRNHDLVVHGRLPNGEAAIVCVEAKAGEALGETVQQYAKAADVKRKRGESTNAPERLQKLLSRYVPHYAPSEERVRLLRYQLLSALAGTEAEAEHAHASHAVLMVHAFMTDQRPADETMKQALDLHRFCTTVFDLEPPGVSDVPWCIEVPAPATMSADLYLAWAVTDLRTSTLEGTATRKRDEDETLQ